MALFASKDLITSDAELQFALALAVAPSTKLVRCPFCGKPGGASFAQSHFPLAIPVQLLIRAFVSTCRSDPATLPVVTPTGDGTWHIEAIS